MANDPSLHSIAEGRFLSLVRAGHWEFVQRRGVSGVVAVVAITDDRRIVLTQQHRPPVHCDCIELPAGLAGDVPGAEREPLVAAARRELLEETGYEAATMELLTRGPSSAGLTDETITLFHAGGLRKTGQGGGDATERITIHEVPLAELPAWLQRQEEAGLLIDYKIFAGLWLAERGRRRSRCGGSGR